MIRGAFGVLVVLVVLAATLFGVTSAAPVIPVEAVDTSALRTAVGAPRIRDHLTALQSIARANAGNRSMGTPGYQASVDYVRQRLSAAGYQVTLQPFQVPYFAETAAPTLTRVLPSRRSYAAVTQVQTMNFSASGDVSAPIAPVDLTIPASPTPGSTSGCEPADFAAFPYGAVALMQRGTCPFTQKANNAKTAGASAVVVMNEGQPDRREPVSGTLERPGIGIPVLGVGYDVGVELAGTPGTSVRVATQVVSEVRDTVNVIADGGLGRADRVVMVGAHLDSVPEGPGINDNGSGVATILEIADQLARQPVTVRNRVRFAFWGAEELGLLGSEHYVAQLSPEQRAAIAVYLNFDMVGSPNFARFVLDGDGSDAGPPGPAGSGVVERVFADYFGTQKLAFETTPFNGRSDYGPFAAAGIPSGGLFSGAEGAKTPAQVTRYGGTTGQSYDSCYHRSCDSIDNISDVALDQFSDAAADAVLRMLLTSVEPRQAR